MVIEYPGIEGNGEIYLDVLKAICWDTSGKSMVDLMCHKAPYTPQLEFAERTYVDVQNRPLDFIEEQQFFVCLDVLWFIAENNKRFDVSICSDGIEHLTVQQANDLTWGMVAMSNKHIFFTPLGELDITSDNHPDSHKTGWTPNSGNFHHCACVIFPDFHPTLNCGAFFAWGLKNPYELPADFKRVKQELNNKSWAKFNK